MLYLFDHTKKSPLVRGTIDMNSYLEYDTGEQNKLDDMDDNMDFSFSLFTQEEYQDHNKMKSCNFLKQVEDNDHSPYHQLIGGFQDVVNVITSQDEVEEVSLFFTSFISRKIAAMGNHNQDKGNAVLFGENLALTRRIERRKKFKYELRR